MRAFAQYRSFPRPVQLLLLNQLTINIGFYMLVPYLAAHLSGELGLATWLVGLVLGVRNFAQQGMFLLGGSLADRFGYKPLIVAGCALRTVGFGLLGVVDSVPALIAASAATGFAGALFNPAVRAYLAQDAGERRVEAFALFSVFYQAGILLGPLIGLALTGVAFSLTCAVAAAVFALLTVLQVRALPQRSGAADTARESMLSTWRSVASNRSFVLFAVAMIGSYVLSFQVYLALPLQANLVMRSELGASGAVAAVFAVSGLVTILGQLRVTAWCRQRLGPGRSMGIGLATMGAAFVPLLVAELIPVEPTGGAAVVVGLVALITASAVLALGTAIVFPFEMDTIVSLSGGRLVATHYGLYNTVCGVGIMLGNLGTGWAMDLARTRGLPAVPWLALLVLGLICAVALRSLRRRGLLPAEPEAKRAGGRHRSSRRGHRDRPAHATAGTTAFQPPSPTPVGHEPATEPLRSYSVAPLFRPAPPPRPAPARRPDQHIGLRRTRGGYEWRPSALTVREHRRDSAP
ncbi:MFS transporter [Pseudonocardia sp. MH-G8]|uniref:MDR family MFS transporter n=1 Tax=Pseudonocardia sp. MH-G8 TaxID=1854588 RepID=UPI000BA189CE|nr:MFS transporter [Pseudonocardia sp. MH-G8]OZM79973.1 MFS transporter [Pseudonocardia sp. MH-G8]